MKGETDTDEKYTRYLLGDLPEEESARLEEEYFTDDAAFERFLSARDELVDLHARGELKGHRRERFERHFLSTGPRRRRAREAKELIDFSTKMAAQEAPAAAAAAARRRGASWLPSFLLPFGGRAPALRFAMTALLLFAALGGAWLLVRREGAAPTERAAATPPPAPEPVPERPPGGGARTRDEEAVGGGATTAPTPAATPLPRRGQAPVTAINRAPQRPSAPSTGTARVASILLTPVLTRDAGQSNTLHVRPDTSTARLRLSFRGGVYRRHVAVLRTIDGEQVWRGPAFVARARGAGGTAVVDVPPRVFRMKDHTVTLYGAAAGGELQEIGEYFFTVNKSEGR